MHLLLPAQLRLASWGGTSISDHGSIWSDLRLLPLYFSALSLLLLLLAWLTYLPLFRAKLEDWLPYPSSYEPTLTRPTHIAPTLWWRAKAHIHSRGGPTIYSCLLLRVAGCAALCGLSLAAALLDHSPGEGSPGGPLSSETLAQFALPISYLYLTILSLCSLLPPLGRRSTRTHATLLLLVLFLIFAQQHLLPLAFFHPTATPSLAPTSHPAWLLPAYGTILFLTSTLLPLLTPRLYHPLSPSAPSQIPPEQTAPPLSFLLFSFLDPLVFTAYFHKKARVHYDELPPLADYDKSEYLALRAAHYLPSSLLDPHPEHPCQPPAHPLSHASSPSARHLLWSILRLFRWDFTRMAFLLSIRVFSGFLGPIGINRLLAYLERPGVVEAGGGVRPWVWIGFLALDPIVSSLSFHLYFFISHRMVVQCESILTQLIFRHSLKVRLTEDGPPGEGDHPTRHADALAPEAEVVVEIVSEGDEVDTTALAVESADLTRESPTLVADSPEPGAGPETSKDQDKSKGRFTPEDQRAQKERNEPQSTHLAGKINNLLGTDLANVTEGRDFLFLFLETPLRAAIGLYMLWTILGSAAVVGMAVMVGVVPLGRWAARWLQAIQVERMKRIDARVGAITEMVNVLRMIKMFGWEEQIKKQIAEKREEELGYTRRRQMVQLLNTNYNIFIPLVTMIIMFTFYALVLGKDLTASKVFSSIVIFELMRQQLTVTFWAIPVLTSAWVSLERINDFLHKTSLLDRYTVSQGSAPTAAAAAPDRDVIGFHNATFTWASTESGTPTPGRRNFRLHLEDLVFPPGVVNLIIGPTGCGKTSILMALLGEMHFHPAGPDSWFSLPREGGVAYAAQESWLQNDTIRNNILFGEQFDEVRYSKVISQCALQHDLTLFEAGDQTEVGEKGITLSGGQKARVTLARAIYSRAQILLLDDVLSALDVHTSRWIVDKCFKGDLIQGRTVLLVTHNVALAASVAGKIVSLDSRGNILNQGSISDVIAKDSYLREEVEERMAAVNAEGEHYDEVVLAKKSAKSDGKLVLEEEMAEGHLGWSALKMLITGFGSAGFWSLCLVGFFTVQAAQNFAPWWLGVWASAYAAKEQGGSDVNVSYYSAVYGAIVLGAFSLWTVTYTVFIFGYIRAMRKIHDKLRDSILGSTFHWLDSTPVGRIISRFTQDMRNIDGPLPVRFGDLIIMTFGLLAKLGGVVIYSPVFIVPGACIAALGGWLGQVYITVQLSVKREMSNRRSPLYNHFTAAMHGLVSIRAYGAEASFHDELVSRIDLYSRPARTYYNLERWIAVRIDILGGLFAAGLASYLVYRRDSIGASNVGFSLSMAAGFVSLILWWVRVFNEVEVLGNSLERILDYIVIEQEPAPTDKGKPPAYWPTSGSIMMENLCARYYQDGPLVLENITFEIKSGERVGIVGRTGSGKSSLTLALLRMIPTTGVVYYDGLPTHSVNLDALRSNLTIIPQDPTLMSGTLRSNLDPFAQYADHELNSALRAAGLYRLQAEGSPDGITLDSPVTSGGANFSVGQRQIIALARAIVRGSKVLILDEATASVDAQTDEAIQSSIRTGSDLRHATLITVAHRLQTIADYDKILVLDLGKLVEFDTPLNLLNREGGLFRALVEQSADREQLWEMARDAARTVQQGL